jgi:hypothetical protein
VAGRYFRAETMKFSIPVFRNFKPNYAKIDKKLSGLKVVEKLRYFEQETLFSAEV